MVSIVNTVFRLSRLCIYNGSHVVYILSRFIHILFLFAVVSAGLSQWVFNAYKTRETL